MDYHLNILKIEIMETNYEQQANDFLNQTETKCKITFRKNGYHFTGDKDNRDIYRVRLSNVNGSFSFDFGQSINGTNKKEIPTNYDILACLTKYDVGSFENFCSEFGYEDSKQAEKTYKAVCKEYENVCEIWSDEQIETLSEIS